jgi:intracellular septation protein A
MKLLFDFLPIILFFGTFKYAEDHKDWAAAFATGISAPWWPAAWSGTAARRRCCWPPWS